MKNLSQFKLIFLGVFVFLAVTGVVLFATFSASNQKQPYANIVIWGTLDQSGMDSYIQKIKSAQKDSPYNITYYQIRPENFDSALTEALANGTNPDAIIVSNETLLRQLNKIVLIPFANISERDYKDAFIESSELFLFPNYGIAAVPFAIDPLVMYWNRDTFTNGGLTVVPQFWDGIKSLAKNLTVKGTDLNISKSGVSFGEYDNVTNAKEIISTLLLQSGVSITAKNEKGQIVGALDKTALPALNFYTSFSSPLSDYYSWNRSLPSSADDFVAGDAATYIGFASELNGVGLKNPNLNFDVAMMPQIKDSALKTVYGDIYGFAILKKSAKQNDAYATILAMASPAYLPFWLQTTYMTPARRDLLAQAQTDPYKAVFYKSAIISKSWLEPSQKSADMIFGKLVGAITANSLSPQAAVDQANNEINAALGN